jgi:prepilin-type N-terminal cleavage/methylation domain-containing protein
VDYHDLTGQEKMKQIMKKKSPSGSSLQIKVPMKTKSGFTLIETLVAILLFALVSVMVMGMFSGFLKNYTAAKKVQRSAESAQYVMNLMAKTIRGSVIANDFAAQSSVMVFDISRSMCVMYKYEAGTLKVATNLSASMDGCQTSPPTVFSPMTKVGEIEGVSFVGVKSIDAAHLGKILISSRVNNGGDIISIQTAVSLRNF